MYPKKKFAKFYLTHGFFYLPSRELVAELPFTLMHPKPDDSDRPSSSSGSHKSEMSGKENGDAVGALASLSTTAAASSSSGAAPTAASAAVPAVTEPEVDTNLIQLDT